MCLQDVSTDDLLRGIRRLDRFFCQHTEVDSSANGDSSNMYFVYASFRGKHFVYLQSMPFNVSQ